MLILGDNPFFGINHASVEKSKVYREAAQALNWDAALATLKAAQSNDIAHLMLTTHQEAPSLLRAMRDCGDLRQFEIIPAVPYLHRLNGIVASKGIPAALAASISYGELARSLAGGASLTASGLVSFLYREITPIMELGFEVKHLALQNIFVDLLLGLGQAHIINEAGQILTGRGMQLVAITMNPIIADRVLNPAITVCTHYNYIGYMVQPCLERFRGWLDETSRTVWAMGTVASGRAEVEKIFADPWLQVFSSVVVGASRPQSIENFAVNYAAIK